MDLDFLPFLRLPFLDLGAHLVTHQQWGHCAKLEMQAMNCLEAYGVHRGKQKCQDLLNDYHECFTNRNQVKRSKMMRLERHRQYYSGERATHYPEPPKSTSFDGESV